MTDIVLFIIGCCVLVLLCGERERQKGAVFGHQLVRLTGHLSAANTVDLTIRAHRTLTDGVGAHPYSWTNGFGRYGVCV